MAGGFEAMSGTKTRPARPRAHILTVNDLYRAMKRQEKIVCEMFLDALRREDADKILQIAQAVRFLKEHQPFTAVDPDRRWLISLKQRLDKHGLRMSVRNVAKFLSESMNKPLNYAEDGFSSLRRKCQELDFPLATRKIRRK
jgi:hypothetical protein